MLTLKLTYADGRSEIIGHPDDTILADLAERFSCEQVEILDYLPVFVAQLEDVKQGFDDSPPENDYQRGYLAAVVKFLKAGRDLLTRGGVSR